MVSYTVLTLLCYHTKESLFLLPFFPTVVLLIRSPQLFLLLALPTVEEASCLLLKIYEYGLFLLPARNVTKGEGIFLYV